MDITSLEHAGHRVDGPHDCFTCNCDGLGPQLESARENIIRLDARIATLEAGLREALDEWEIADGRLDGEFRISSDPPCEDEIRIAELRALLDGPAGAGAPAAPAIAGAVGSIQADG